jgi:hypothetical protein
MPLYEYECREDGAVLELLRPMARADDPVPDPEGKGRVFTRRHSTFSPGSAGGEASLLSRNSGGCCPCGKQRGMCGNG